MIEKYALLTENLSKENITLRKKLEIFRKHFGKQPVLGAGNVRDTLK
jgi:hypothetical protein